jgi:cysteine-rich repeat protein
MENPNNNMASQKPKKKGWLILILSLVVLAAAVVIIVLTQSGQFFKGEVSVEPGILGQAVVSKSSITQKSNGPFLHVSTSHGEACPVGSVLGTASCPFSTIEEAEKQIKDQNIQTVEIRLMGGNIFRDENGIELSGGRKSIIGGWDESFSKITGSSVIFFNTKIINANGSIQNLYSHDAGTSKPFIEVDNNGAQDGTTFEVKNIILDKITNTDSLIKFGSDNYKTKGLIENVIINNSKVTNGSLVEVVGNPAVKIQKNHFNASDADESIIHVDANVEILNNLITNSPSNGINTQNAVLIDSGDDVKLINNTIVNNNFTDFAVKQTGEGLMWVFNNLIDDNTKALIFNMAEINQLAARGNTWGIIDYRETKSLGVNETSNFSCNPKFAGGDINSPLYYKLGGDSDCLDKGWSVSNVVDLVSPDYFGVNRPVGDGVDPGFSEYITTFQLAPFQAEYIPIPVCGNGTVESNEECDDGNTVDNDGCSATCTTEQQLTPVCGNSTVEQGEQCDDGNTLDGDGCSSTCNNEQAIGPVCGNGNLEQGEECDDGNTLDGDGCSAICENEQEETDECPNLEGIQSSIPSGYHHDSNNNCVLDEEVACGEWSDVSDNDPEYDIWVWLCDRGIFKGNEDGTLRPDDKLTRAELLALAFRASDYENVYELDEEASYCFNDVDDQWFAPYACTATDLGFVEGYAGNIFKPGNAVILAEGLKMFLGALDEPYTINPNPNRWYYDMLQDAADDNYLPYTLTDESVVGPIELTRRKAANMLYRILIYR